jgi:hypothetical protein
MFRLRVALLTAIAPTILIAAMLAIAFAVRGTALAPGWPARAGEGIALFYLLIVALMLFSTRKAGKP